MFISDEQWNKIKKYVFSLNWMEQFMGEDIRKKYQEMKNYFNELDKALKTSSKIYVITNNAIVDDNIDYSIYGVATNIKDARKLFKEAVRNVKIDADFKKLDAIDLNKEKKYFDEDMWYFQETKNSFELYLNGEYNSNNYLVEIKEFDLSKNREKIKNNAREL